ncbi:MAG: hypothetical protein M3065_14090 [Actinomycetota bacterium]|nr:hypothetical protein [Actinomycetota bacterium]
MQERKLAFTASSARAYLDAEFRSHPLWVAGAPVLRAGGAEQAVRDRAVGILEAGNEQPGAFRCTSRYVIASATRRHE